MSGLWECWPCGSVRCVHVAHLNHLEVVMANASAELSVMDRAWVKKSLEFQRAGLVRSVAKEMPGSDIAVLRGKEIAALDVLINRFSKE